MIRTHAQCPRQNGVYPSEDPGKFLIGVVKVCMAYTRFILSQIKCSRRTQGLFSSEIGECDVFFTCRLGVGIPTKCSEGLHYSEEVTNFINLMEIF